MRVCTFSEAIWLPFRKFHIESITKNRTGKFRQQCNFPLSLSYSYFLSHESATLPTRFLSNDLTMGIFFPFSPRNSPKQQIFINYTSISILSKIRFPLEVLICSAACGNCAKKTRTFKRATDRHEKEALKFQHTFSSHCRLVLLFFLLHSFNVHVDKLHYTKSDIF